MTKQVPYNVLNDELKKDFRKFLYLVWKHLGLPGAH